ncbi:phosphomannose isomerase type II C-terminal cupin domain [Variovorax sp. PCZ-1]|uniref:phosphomannose isomerase type II C-terminal cupin domain n=1 Tax=Variovorax sp. PCZ-1 TaxID=2835533 RepID=UPI001BCD6113|nr:phosphomannose isomerase type II C-terminal cupin domain [Variovorax sp. PCZ-1]MBS7808126.1 phosphomannose isomerase type II C-terminal cupin domain [Variovorax sp. PCZ-1]
MSTTTYRNHTVERTERPWGWYESIDEAPGLKVKRIGVHPGKQISLQKHAQRAEHWLVVRGKAVVTLGQADGSMREIKLEVGQHCDIALGQIHRLANRTEEPVEIVEVQLGSYLGEDDITRLADDFGRV